MSFSFANNLGELVITSISPNPYDAFQNRLNHDNHDKTKLCIVSDNLVIHILNTKMISVKWAVSCAKHVLHIFEERYPYNKKPRKAIEAASNWIKDPSEKNIINEKQIKNICKDAAKVAYLSSYYASFAAYSTSYFASSVFNDCYSVEFAFHVADYASKASPNQFLEIKWQRKKFNQIVYEEVLVLLVKSQYHRINNKLVRKIPQEILEYIGSFITG